MWHLQLLYTEKNNIAVEALQRKCHDFFARGHTLCLWMKADRKVLTIKQLHLIVLFSFLGVFLWWLSFPLLEDWPQLFKWKICKELENIFDSCTIEETSSWSSLVALLPEIGNNWTFICTSTVHNGHTKIRNKKCQLASSVPKKLERDNKMTLYAEE